MGDARSTSWSRRLLRRFGSSSKLADVAVGH
jgi:hypothetical protein